MIINKVIIYCFFCLLCIIYSCTQNTNRDRGKHEETKKIFITEGYELNCITSDENKYFYITLNGKKHGIFYQYDQYNKINSKRIYYNDTLMQSKEYHWGYNKLDSVCFFTYDYRNKDFVVKNFYLNYPLDSLFFVLKYNPFCLNESTYTIELVGKGIITTIPNTDTIFSENYFSHFDKMVSASKSLHMQQVHGSKYEKEKISQSFGLSIDYGEKKYLKRQIKIYFVPLFVKDSSIVKKLGDMEIIF